ncbi:MAG: 50S ribosomal protein L23 [Patescibacteria group bacterium]
MNKPAGHILLAPRITEKAAYLAESGCYAFNVAPTATKAEVARAIRDVYGIVPRKVTFVALVRKAVRTRGTNRVGRSVGGKKAYVHLKHGDKIDLA